MGTSIGPAFSYLLANLPAALQAVNTNAQVFDSWATDENCPAQFVIGRSQPNESSMMVGSNDLQILGAGRVDEDYEIPCYLLTFAGGTNQAEARSSAVALWDAWVHFLASDRTLGGAISQGGWAQVARINYDGTPPENAAQGRFCLITFTLRIRNHYIP